MARPIRFDPEDGWHHVMNRGANRQRTFFVEADGERFLSLIHEGCELFAVQVHAFCLMPNHFHLLLHLPHAGLSAFMQRLGSRYTRYVNDRRGADGALFRGRFRSILVDDVAYRSVVGRYIHRNPIDLGREGRPTEYRWSSLHHYLNSAECPPWLQTDVLLSNHSSLSTFCDYTVGSPEVAPTTSIVRWAIDVALNEVFDEDDRDLDDHSKLRRTIALLMLPMVDPHRADLITAIGGVLRLPNPSARHAAMYRSRRRAESEPLLLTVAARTLRLCDLTVGV